MRQRTIQECDVAAKVDVVGHFISGIEDPVIVETPRTLNHDEIARRDPGKRKRSNEQQQHRRRVPIARNFCERPITTRGRR